MVNAGYRNQKLGVLSLVLRKVLAWPLLLVCARQQGAICDLS
jgi:hypothetical protein